MAEMNQRSKGTSQLSKVFLFFSLLTSLSLLLFSPVYADELEELERKLSELKRALEMSRQATTNLEVSYTKLQAQLADIQKRISLIERDLAKKVQEVIEGETVLADQQLILEKRIRTFYKRSYYFSPLLTIFFQKGLTNLTQEFVYQRYITDEDKRTITAIVLYIKELEEKKRQLEVEQDRLAVVQSETDRQTMFLQNEIAGAKVYQQKLAGEIAKLTSRQQELVAKKLASLNLPTTLGAGPLICIDDRKLDPGFTPAFAFYTFGIPHRVGMNQYGAFGRAKAGQSFQDILRTYYQGISFEKRDPQLKIKVEGYGEMELDKYLLGIYEMPNDWPLEALKAQAVAARSYALSYTNNGEKEICTSQRCQVYKGGNKGGAWEEAVKQTQGEVMVKDGQVITAWYASTAGGYTFTSLDVGWGERAWTKRLRDAPAEINNFADLFEKAYDRDSPCFYAAQGSRSEYGKSAWLKTEEVADIVNVLLLSKNDPSVQKHLAQVDRPNPDGVETWDKERVREELRSRQITPFNNLATLSIDWDKSGGITTTVHVSSDAGSASFSGSEFKDIFNLRAPANIQIVGPLFAVERK